MDNSPDDIARENNLLNDAMYSPMSFIRDQ